MSTLTGAPYGQTETGAAYTEAAARVRQIPKQHRCTWLGCHRRQRTGLMCAEHWVETHDPARLLGVAQQAIKNALLMDDLDAIKQKLAADLARITPPAVPA